MSNGETYEVVCRQGRRKDECPLVMRQGWHCVECSYAGYILREKHNTSEENSEQPENIENES